MKVSSSPDNISDNLGDLPVLDVVDESGNRRLRQDKGILLQEVDIILDGFLEIGEWEKSNGVHGRIGNAGVGFGRIRLQLITEHIVLEGEHTAIGLQSIYFVREVYAQWLHRYIRGG